MPPLRCDEDDGAARLEAATEEVRGVVNMTILPDSQTVLKQNKIKRGHKVRGAPMEKQQCFDLEAQTFYFPHITQPRRETTKFTVELNRG